jgi:hypothetical protein
VRNRSEEGAIGFDVQAVRGHQLGGFTKFPSVFKGDDARKGDIGPTVETLTDLIGSSGKAVNNGSLRHALSIENIKEIRPRISGVDDKSQIQFFSQLDLIGEHLSLDIARTVFVVVVKTTFSNTDESWRSLTSQGRYLGHSGRGVMGVHTHCGAKIDETVAMSIRQGNGLSRSRSVGADHHDASHAFGVRTLQGFVNVLDDLLVSGEVSLLEMTVSVGPGGH